MESVHDNSARNGQPESASFLLDPSGNLRTTLFGGVPSNHSADIKAGPSMGPGPYGLFESSAYPSYSESQPSSILGGDGHDTPNTTDTHLSIKAEPQNTFSPAQNGYHDARTQSVDQSETGPADTVENMANNPISTPTTSPPGLGVENTSNGTRFDAITPISTPVPNLSNPAVGTSPDIHQIGRLATTHSASPSNPANHANNSTPRKRIKLEEGAPVRRPSTKAPKLLQQVHRAKISIPSDIPSEEYARQCILAASWSRLNPYALHPGEYRMLRQYITGPQVTTYINIRNGILRLWVRNPMVCVTREEAAGCAKESRFFELAYTAHEWLVRQGYINFGCVKSPSAPIPPRFKPSKRQETVVVIGAGMAGLCCARQLEHLFEQFAEYWYTRGELPPKVTVLEGRNRIGGRIYSFPLRSKANGDHPAGARCVAEMGAQIVTGFERGNPLNAIIRGQLGLHIHAIQEGTVLYDIDGSTVDRKTDDRVEGLFNDILERASKFRNLPVQALSLEGDVKLIDAGKDPTTDGAELISVLESRGEPVNVVASQGRPKKKGQTNAPVTMEKLTGRSYQATETKDLLAAAAAKKLGFKLREGVPQTSTVQLEKKAQEHMSNLGDVMDEACRQYQDMVNLTEQDLRLLNWHYANLEYASAAPVGSLSLTGWDQDSGNEFEGAHTEVIGGYTQVPRGLYHFPTLLDVKLGHAVHTIEHHATDSDAGATVFCANGGSVKADRVVLTVPLGVLKARTINFQPELPEWKLGSIDRMGFGLLNKLVLVYDTPFWEQDRDMFGLLHDAIIPQSRNMKDYAAQRGLFYIFWNTMKTSGAPTLVAMMAGNAAYAVENVTDAQLVEEAQTSLAQIFGQIPRPKETIITRWRKDPFARGSYSYVGPNTKSDDYENMALPVGRIHFAGEATCGTHPATVHGAYLSGLRAACEVLESFIGPMDPGQPLVGAKARQSSSDGTPAAMQTAKRPMADAVQIPERQSRAEMNKAWEDALNQKITDAIGMRPLKPVRAGTNPFLLWQRDKWQEAKKKCDEAKRAKHPKAPDAKASKDEIRKELGKSWQTASAEEKKPYYEMTEAARAQSKKWHADFKELVEKWDRDAERIKQEFSEANPLSEWVMGYAL